MTAAVENYLELRPDERSRTWPWCIWCAQPLNTGAHDRCRSKLDGSLWTPCLTCHGGRVDTDGTRCADCLGVGFWEFDSLEAACGGFTILDEADRQPGRPR